MIPIRDEVKPKTFPIVNTIIIITNVALFIYQIQLGEQIRDFVFSYGLIPAIVTSAANLPLSDRIVPFFTSMFLHGDWLHILGNMLFLYIFGDNVEDRMGHFRYLLFYVITGIFAALLHIAINPLSPVPMIGASGAISGVLGAYLIYFPRARVLTIIPIIIFIHFVYVPAAIFIILWFVIQLVSGIFVLGSETTGGIAFWAHIGGFVAGVILAARYFRYRYRKKFF